MSLCAGYAGTDSVSALAKTSDTCVAAYGRASLVLRGRGQYERAWHTYVRGYATMHLTNPRYKLADLELVLRGTTPVRGPEGFCHITRDEK